LEEIVAQEIEEGQEFTSFVPWSEIALMQPDINNQKLFSN